MPVNRFEEFRFDLFGPGVKILPAVGSGLS